VPTWFDDYQRTKDDAAARRGAAEAKSETLLGSILHELADLERGIIPIPRGSEERAREDAYHKTPKGWERSRSRDSVATCDSAPSAAGSGDYRDYQSSSTTGPKIRGGSVVGLVVSGLFFQGFAGDCVSILNGPPADRIGLILCGPLALVAGLYFVGCLMSLKE
jgi:hypothetical protein